MRMLEPKVSIMLECGHSHIRTKSNITQFFLPPKSKAIAAANLLKVIYWVMKEKRNHYYHG
jgi:hypothetical protein